jgi:hypothetical protein
MKLTALRPWTMAVCMLAMLPLHAQVSTPANAGSTGDFVGWDNTMITDPLMIRHNANQPIQWWTNNALRMQLTPTLLNQNWAWYQQNNLNFSGHLGIGNPTPQTPLTYLHINSSPLNFITVGYRPWMRVGTFFTQGTDGLYTGMRLVNGQTQGVVNWSDDAGVDPLSFVFTSTPDNTNVANTLNGLEIVRMVPDANGNEGYLGVGDFFTATAQPNERLDVLDGRVRIRQLPNDDEEPTEDKVMVVDDDGVVKWRSATGIVAAGDCKWTMNGGVNNKNVYTAVGTSSSCPSNENRVGIGVNNPAAKLEVYRQGGGLGHRAGFFRIDGGSGPKTGLAGRASGTGEIHVGVEGIAVNATDKNWALEGRASLNNVSGVDNYGAYCAATLQANSSATTNAGVRANAVVNGTATVNNSYGVFAHSDGFGQATISNQGAYAWGRASSGSTITSNYGINAFGNVLNSATVTSNFGVRAQATSHTTNTATNYGIWSGASGAAVNWAGWFDGDVNVTGVGYIPGGVWQPSDESLKANVEELLGASVILAQLSPRTYTYLTEEHPNAGLPDGTHAGLMAQELEALLPALVQEVNIPALTDSMGQVLTPAETIKAINYNGMIPYLISAFNEQQARLDQLEQALALCCTNPSDGQQLQTPGDGTEGRMLPDAGSERLLTIAPNPFTEQTTVSYTLERGGRAMLMVNGSDGKHLQVLEEGQRSEGQYQYVWHTAHLAPGVYYVTLLLDGEPLVKRAVKVR